MQLATRLRSVRGSATSGARRRAQQLAAAGTGVINLAAGELPDPPPPVVLRALAGAATAGGTNLYAATSGVTELRAALARRIAPRLGGTDLPADQVLITCGAKQALYLAAMVLFGTGDDVLLPVPAWGTFEAQLALAGARAVRVETGADRHRPTAAGLEAALTPATRGVLLNTPNNPTGAVYDAETIAVITDFAIRHDLWLVIDESYADLVHAPARHVHPLEVRPQAGARTVSIGSFSKSFAVTGWRVGYLYGPGPVVAGAASLQSHLTSGTANVLQQALLPAARGEADGAVEAALVRLHRRLRTVEESLERMPEVSWNRPEGTFYAFLDFGRLLGRTWSGKPVASIDELADRLLTATGVATTPGTAFADATHLRLSLTVSDDELIEALHRMERFVNDVD